MKKLLFIASILILLASCSTTKVCPTGNKTTFRFNNSTGIY